MAKFIKRGPVRLTRKQQRKQNRHDKKAKKHEYFSKKKVRPSDDESSTKLKRSQINEHAAKKSLCKNNGSLKKSPTAIGYNTDTHKNCQSNKKLSLLDETLITIREEKKQAKQLQKEIKKQRVNKLKQDAASDDIEIKRLEKKLGLKKRSDKSKTNFFAADGLDYVLDICDMKGSESTDTGARLRESDDDEFGDDLQRITGLKTSKRKSREDDSDEFELSEGSEDDSIGSDSRGNTSEPEDNQSGSEGSSSDEDMTGNIQKVAEIKKTKKLPSDDLPPKKREIIKKHNKESDNQCNSLDEDMVWEQLKARKAQSNDGIKKFKASDKTPKSNKVVDCGGNSGDESGEEPAIDDSIVNDGTWEDIYGRTRDKQGNIIEKYQPPHVREKLDTSGSNEKLQRLNKQLKGLLNRLAENNMASISSQIEVLYSQHSRNEMNETIWALYENSLVSETLTPERLIAEHALLLAILSANVGTEVAAHCLQRAVNKYHSLLLDAPQVPDKRTNNMLLLLSFMCHLKLFHGKLLFDILDELLNDVNEKEVELVLTILRTVGFTLRKEDPIRLKNFIVNTQQLANNSTADVGTRAKFLLETIIAIKNNNISKIPNYNPEYGENLKKIMRACIRKGNYNAELKISLEDLLKADERGRWWVVGSAWTGELQGEKKAEQHINENKADAGYSSKLLELAKKQRMNTDARRSVFCVLMSAEDYLDAFEKLLRLRLQGAQEREVMNVLLHCLLRENTYNPYYEHVARKFCTANRRFQIMLQFATWDKIQDIKSLSKTQVTSLSKFLGNLIVKKDLAISVLKVVELGGLDKASMRFMRQVLLTILLSESDEEVMCAFARVSGSKPLKMFRESLRLFLHHFVLRNSKQNLNTDMELLTVRVKMADSALSSSDKSPAF